MPREVFKVEVDGLQPFLRRLKKIEKKSRRRAILRSAMMAGTVPVKKALRNEIKTAGAIEKGHLRKAVSSVVRVYRSGVVVIMAGIRHRKLPDGENPGNYFHLVDLGVREHSQQTGNVYIEDIDGHRQIPLAGRRQPHRHPGFFGQLMKRAAERKAWPKVFDAMADKLDKGLAKELGRG